MARNATKMLRKRGPPPRVEERGIRTPNKNDVVSGRGKAVHTKLGNVHYLTLVKQSRRAYVLTPKCDKGKFATSIVAKIKGMDPPGRFLIRDPKSGFWNEMNHKDSVTKTRQCLSEGAPKLLKEIKERANMSFLIAHRAQRDKHEEAVQSNMNDSSLSPAVPTNPPDEVRPLALVAPNTPVLLQRQHNQDLSPVPPQVNPNLTTQESSSSRSESQPVIYRPETSVAQDMCRSRRTLDVATLPQFPAPVLLQHQDISLVAPQVQVNPNPTTTRASSRIQSQPARVIHCPEDSIVQDMLCRKALDELRFRTIQLQRLEIEARIAEGRVRLSLAEQQVQYLCHLSNVVDPMARFDPDGHHRNANNAGLPVFGNGQRRRARYEEHPYATNLPDPMQSNQVGMHDVSHNDDSRSSLMPDGCGS